MTTIGQRIRDRRKDLRLSVDELAAKLGKDRSTVYRYEKGDIENLPLDILQPIAAALETTPGYLMGWRQDPEELGAVAARVLRDHNLLKLVQDYMVLSEADKQAVGALVASLAANKKTDA